MIRPETIIVKSTSLHAATHLLDSVFQRPYDGERVEWWGRGGLAVISSWGARSGLGGGFPVSRSLNPRTCRTRIFRLLAPEAILLIAAVAAGAQEIRGLDRTRGSTMLNVIRKEIQKYYYDPMFHGLDIEARFRRAEQDIGQVTSLGQMYGVIAQAVLDLDDSHTLFVPPARIEKYRYGWVMRMIDATPYILAVKPGTDAAGKGLKAGDVVLSVDGVVPTRQNLSLLKYRYYCIRPAPCQRLTVKSPGGQPRPIDVVVAVKKGNRLIDFTRAKDIWETVRPEENESREVRAVGFQTNSGIVLIWHLPTFLVNRDELKRYIGRVQQASALVLDLRGNTGGYIETAAWLLGIFFDHDVTIARPTGRRKKMKPVVAKAQGKKAFTGKVVVIVDSDTTSSAELFARVIQLENRGTVIGDHTAGRVMQARFHPKQLGRDVRWLYGISIAEADLIMADGKSLEKRGVTPDIMSLPTGEDLAAGRDPVLTQAARLVGLAITPTEAGKCFPYKWVD
jgi:C-terminal processing protease CtpA/Prc